MEFDIDRILMVIFEEVRKMPGKDLRVKLNTMRAELDKRFTDVMDTLSKAARSKEVNKPLRRGGQNDTKIK